MMDADALPDCFWPHCPYKAIARLIDRDEHTEAHVCAVHCLVYMTHQLSCDEQPCQYEIVALDEAA